MISFHNEKKAILTMLVKQIEQSSRYGTVTLNLDDKIVKFSEKSYTQKAWISAGYFFLSKNKIPWEKYATSFSYEELLFPDLAKSGKSYGYRFHDYFIDIGTPDSYNQFVTDVSTNKILF
jgi:D-glycero-alpha-D-manno-heptose 1-phosphate guanylyltransferase